jgi:hypothetical protein
MGEAPRDLNDIAALAAEVDSLRERTQSLVAELERRVRASTERTLHLVDRGREALARVRHAVDVKAQFAERPLVVMSVGAAAALTLGLGVYFTRARRRALKRPLNRLRARLSAYRTLLAEPERALRHDARLGQRLIAAVIVAGATTIVRGLTRLLVAGAPPSRQLPAAQRLPPHTT